ncbi:MAG: hemerythrin family protein [Desulfobulbaceae bacterium]|nr:hemerythrin family protein [Desulfobulbaceae bacterium]
MQWDKKYALGIPVVDTQHRQLFRLSNELDAELQAGIRSEEIDAMLIHIGEYAARHFAMEEKYMAESDYPGLAEQQATHQAFAKRFVEIYDEFKKEGLSREIVDTLRRELTDWVREHVTGLDQRFGAYYRDRQSTAKTTDSL